MKKLFIVTALICLMLNGIIIRTWLLQQASAKEKIDHKELNTADQLAFLKK
jgi:hypothetical protein